MTDLEKKIINLLEMDARYSPATIAVMLGITETEVKEIIESLETRGVIVKYTAVINQALTDTDYVDALIEVTVTPQKRSGFDHIAEEICRSEMVKNVYLMSGSYDIAITIEGKTVRDIALFVSERLAAIDCVVSTTTHFILKQYKNGGVILEDSAVESRELVR